MRLLEQEEFDSLIPNNIFVRPFVGKQVRKYLNSSYFTGLEFEYERAEAFLRRVERKGYATKILQKNTSGRQSSPDLSAPYWAMLKNWGRKNHQGQEDFARGTFYYLLREIRDPLYFIEIAKQVWDPRDLRFQKLFVAKFSDGQENSSFKQVCERYRAKNDTIRRDFKEIWTGPYLGPPPLVKLGPISISMGYKDGLTELLVDDLPKEPYILDGMPNVFKALSWRARLTKLLGRQDQFERLKNWAREPDDETNTRPRVMLVSGPGGSGKSRLVADVVRDLIHDHGWAGGQLPPGKDYQKEIDGDGVGVALIIDYPEERTAFVKRILETVTTPHKAGRPVRIFLVSRERLSSWKNILNQPNPYWIETEDLQGSPYLGADDTLKLINEAKHKYSEELGSRKTEFTDVSGWIEQHASHRLPLIALAAAVHALLEPNEAFSLSGEKVLLALAEIELKRVRNYSDRDLSNQSALETLLGLSILTETGLTAGSLQEIGNSGIWPLHNGASLVEAVERTPFWSQPGESDGRFLKKLEPDLFAAAFLFLVFKLGSAKPSLPGLIGYAILQTGPNYASILARLALDLGHISPAASQIIEDLSVQALDLSLNTVKAVQDVVYTESSTFSAKFVAHVCKCVLTSTNDPQLRATLKNSLANRLSDLGNREEALICAGESALIFEQLAKTEPEQYTQDLAMALNNLGNRLSDQGQHKKAFVENSRAVKIYKSLADGANSDDHSDGDIRQDFANALHNLSSVNSDLCHLDAALSSAQAALAIRQDLVDEDRAPFLPELAMSYNNLGNILADCQLLNDALRATENALELHQELAEKNPDTFEPLLANSYSNLSIRYGDLLRDTQALDAAKEAVRIYDHLANLRPESYSEDLARTLNNLALRYTLTGNENKACESAEHAIQIFRPLAEDFPKAFSLDLALSLNNFAASLINLEYFERALPQAQEAVSVFYDMDQPDFDRFASDRAMAENNLAEILGALDRLDEALAHAKNAEGTFRALVDRGKDNHLPDLALSLNNAGAILQKMKRYSTAIVKVSETVQIALNLVDREGGSYKFDLAYAYYTLSNLHLEIDQRDDALGFITNAMEALAASGVDELQGYAHWIEAIEATYVSTLAASNMDIDEGLRARVSDISCRLHNAEIDDGPTDI